MPFTVVCVPHLMYTNTRTRVVSPDGTSDEFEIKAGVLEGDTLAPFLFVNGLFIQWETPSTGGDQTLV